MNSIKLSSQLIQHRLQVPENWSDAVFVFGINQCLAMWYLERIPIPFHQGTMSFGKDCFYEYDFNGSRYHTIHCPRILDCLIQSRLHVGFIHLKHYLGDGLIIDLGFALYNEDG
jgi:hypothetical protein